MISAIYLDCCLPDYFAGSNSEVLAVPMHYCITYREALEACKETFQSSDVELDTQDVLTALDDLFALVMATDADKPADFARYIEPTEDDDDGDTVYLYVGLSSN
jgi:hypothetical protein